MTKVTGWDNGLSQDYDKGLGRWFANRLGARQQLRQDFEMTQVLIDRATPEQLVEAAEGLMEWQVKNVKVWHNSAYDTMDMRLGQLRAALAGAEPRKVEKVKRREPTIDLGKYAGTYGGYITKDTL